MIGRQQVDERPHARVDPLAGREVRRADRLHLHRLLDAVVAGGQQLPLPLHCPTLHLRNLDATNTAGPDGLEVLLVAENRDRVAGRIVGIGLRGGVVDRGGSGHRPALGVAENLPLRISERHRLGHRHLAAVDLDRDLLLEVERRDLVHADELAVDIAGEKAVLFRQHEPMMKAVVGWRCRVVR